MLKRLTAYDKTTNDVIGRAFGTDEQIHEYTSELYKRPDRANIKVSFNDSIHSLNFVHNKERIKLSLAKILKVFK